MSIAGKTIAIIGGAGFIGSHLAEQLAWHKTPPKQIRVFDNGFSGDWHNLVGLWDDKRLLRQVGDIRDYTALKDALEGVDIVFHLAAIDLKKCQYNPDLGIDVNINGTLNILEACTENEVDQLVFSSSASVYGDIQDNRATEAHPLNNKTIYGATKIAGEQLIKAWTYRTGLQATCLRYMNVYGPRQGAGKAYTDIITKVIKNTLRNQRTEIYGAANIYDFIYVEDVARANILAAFSPTNFEVYNIGCGEETCIEDLVRTILIQMKSNIQPIYPHEGYDPLLVRRRVGNSKKALQELGFSWRISLNEGLRKTIDYLRGKME